MSMFNKLPGFQRSPPGLEQRVWKQLPAVLFWGTLLPVVLALAKRVNLSGDPMTASEEKVLLIWDFMMVGLVLMHWMLVIAVGLVCFIVWLMKGPAYVADAYPLPDYESEPRFRRF